MAAKISVDEVPAALRIRSRNDFITGVLADYRDNHLQGPALAVDIAKAQIGEFIAEMHEFARRHYPEQFKVGGEGGNVTAGHFPGVA